MGAFCGGCGQRLDSGATICRACGMVSPDSQITDIELSEGDAGVRPALTVPLPSAPSRTSNTERQATQAVDPPVRPELSSSAETSPALEGLRRSGSSAEATHTTRAGRGGKHAAAAAGVLALATTGVVFYKTIGNGPDVPGAQSPAATIVSSSAPSSKALETAPTVKSRPTRASQTTSVTKKKKIDPEEAARSELQKLRASSLEVFAPHEQWIVQLASKWHGIVDLEQTTKKGSHTFTVVDILSEYRELRQRFGDSVILITSTDFAKQIKYPRKPANEPLWTTIYDPGDLDSREDAEDWCLSAYPNLDKTSRMNVCLPKQATPPHR